MLSHKFYYLAGLLLMRPLLVDQIVGGRPLLLFWFGEGQGGYGDPVLQVHFLDGLDLIWRCFLLLNSRLRQRFCELLRLLLSQLLRQLWLRHHLLARLDLRELKGIYCVLSIKIEGACLPRILKFTLVNCLGDLRLLKIFFFLLHFFFRHLLHVLINDGQ